VTIANASRIARDQVTTVAVALLAAVIRFDGTDHRNTGGPAMDTKTETKHYPVTHTDAEWRKILTPEQFHIMREHGTERPGSCALNYEKRAGAFYCAGCGQKLFVSKTKFESGTGWPSFNDPEPGAVESSTDNSLFMSRTEVHCSRCGSHLGHVFEDGPPPTHLRFCINGVAMNFKPE
jgi:peptide-methionine (R)-S-oxide reductase